MQMMGVATELKIRVPKLITHQLNIIKTREKNPTCCFKLRTLHGRTPGLVLPIFWDFCRIFQDFLDPEILA